MLPILNIISPHLMLSNILLAQINMACLSTPSHIQKLKSSVIFHIIKIRRPTQNLRCLPRQNSTNSQPSVTPTGEVNLVVQSKKALLLNCSNFTLYLWFSHLPLWRNNCMEINPSKPNSPQFLKSQNHGHQWMHHRTEIPWALFQRHRNSIRIR